MPRVWDIVLAAFLYIATLLAPYAERHAPPRPRPPWATTTDPLTMEAVVIGLVVCGALVFRRSHPRAALAACLGGLVVYFALGGDRTPLDLGPMIAVYTVALHSARRTAWFTGLAVSLVLAGSRFVFAGESLVAPELLAQVAWIGMATAIGDAVRSRRAYVAAIEERARRAEATREEEAERRVMEERLRIARELHDVLAHHIALINVQAQVAAHVLDSRPDEARQALGHVRNAGKEALNELRTTVGLLRRPGSPDDVPAEPSPGLDRLPDLIASFTAAGLNVECLAEGVPRPLPAPVELAAFRIFQEALTNVSKHATDAGVHVRLGWEPGQVTVQVTDDGPGGPPTGGAGHGLIGMRERALSVGGTFSAGPDRRGGWCVHAVLPAPEGALA
ncbi:Signal transduction histidine kinase [Nonomuraea solani]|uniref:histidine kinase n=1 Tax=Nonomuraea solani TaxID=1144553 RepID=A0A1H6EQ24_9ACTN|nr:Signal transduction histidine kinase [Nonomuraea solani]